MTESTQSKESPLKMLLTAPASYFASSNSSVPQINVTSPVTDNSDEGTTKLITYFHQISSSGEKELDPVFMDHSYARPWNWRPETSYIRPTKTLFISKTRSKGHNPALHVQRSSENNDLIDVESTDSPPTPIYDVENAKEVMDECEKHAANIRTTDDHEDWEETVEKISWSSAQSRLFSSMVKILNSDQMGRLTYSNSWNEPVMRRVIIDKSVQRVRNLMASISWDPKLTQWLHNLLLDHLSASYLGAYLDILQTLKAKLPYFVEKLIFAPACYNRNNENIYPVLKKPWDPVISGLVQDKPKKLPGNPIFIVAPHSTSSSATHSKYIHKWVKLLSTLAHVITVHATLGATSVRMNMTNCADHLFNATRAKLQEVRNDCPGRPIILVGFNTGSAVVCQVAEVEHAVAIVCLGFPLLTAEGRRGEPDDYLLDLMYPVLFVIGQNSHRTSREEMEDLRERMRIETGLVVVGSADDYLRVSKSKRRAEGITQSIVDRCILDEISGFVGSILLSPYPPVTKPVYSEFKHLKRVRNNSNTSSIESEPPSPQPRPHHRPGRPPGSGKKRLNYQGLASFLTKPEPFRLSSSQEQLNRAIQSITPVTTSQQMIPPDLVGRPVTSHLSTLLTTGMRPSSSVIHSRPQNTNSGLKILENISINTNVSQKLLSNGRPITLLNTVGGNRSTNLGNVVLLPDGTKYIRPNTNLPIRTVGGVSTILPTIQRQNQGITKFVPTRRQIITKTRAPPQENPLPPPTNLTTADIMDLPIIFADDNILPENAEESSYLPQKKQNKLVVINKQIVANPQILKRPATNIPRQPQQPVKFAKIIVSKKPEETKKPNSPKKMDFENVDLETELKATAVPKPFINMKNKQDLKQLLQANKKATLSIDGKLTNVTLRVPVSFARNVGTPSRFMYSEASTSDNTSHIVLNRTVSSNKDNLFSYENEGD